MNEWPPRYSPSARANNARSSSPIGAPYRRSAASAVCSLTVRKPPTSSKAATVMVVVTAVEPTLAAHGVEARAPAIRTIGPRTPWQLIEEVVGALRDRYGPAAGRCI